MKISVVIPTHDRIDLLRDAVETVRRQDHSEWELVVFDNGSSDDTGKFAKGIADPRVRYERSDVFLPVTDSWNRAINSATGDYVTFLGDDDGLAPKYFTRLIRVIRDFALPEVLYTAIYQFVHPGVAPWEPQGYVADVKNGFFFIGRDAPFLLSPDEASKAVHGSVGLRRNFTFNMQAFCFKQDFLNRLRRDGPIFRSPYPDYYFANVAFAKARNVVVVPEPLGIAGVSKASYGFTLFNELEEKGVELLNAKLTSDPLYAEVERFLLPGPLYNTNYVITMEHVFRYARDLLHHGVAYGRYRRLQIYKVLNSAALGKESQGSVINLLWSRLSVAERAWTLALRAVIAVSRFLGLYKTLVVPVLSRLVEPYGFYPPEGIISRGQHSRLIQVFETLQGATREIQSAPSKSGSP